MAEHRLPTYVVVGAGLAGAKAVEALRENGFDGRLVLVGAETHLPYERPALSKDYLLGKSERDAVFVHPQAWYAEHDVELRLGTPVTALDRGSRHVVTADGERLGYDKLLLVTGSSPRTLPVAGADLDAVVSLRTVDDSDRIKAALHPDARIVVVGGGWIGLEVAAAARAAGAHVTVLETAELPLLRVLGPEIAAVFADLHRANGVDLRTGVTVTVVEPGDDAAAVVRLGDGSALPADLVLVGVGITPNTGLAEAAGLDVDDGIVVDEHMRTSDPDVLAAGDVANAYHPVLGRHLRVEHWANALHQPAVAASTMLGTDATFDRLPYFYTDQYDLGMEYHGYVDPADGPAPVVRGDLAARRFTAFWVRDGHVAAGLHVNEWDQADDVKAVVRSRRPVDEARLADPGIPLSAHLEGDQG